MEGLRGREGRGPTITPQHSFIPSPQYYLLLAMMGNKEGKRQNKGKGKLNAKEKVVWQILFNKLCISLQMKEWKNMQQNSKPSRKTQINSKIH